MGFRHEAMSSTRGSAVVSSAFSHFDKVNPSDFRGLTKGKMVSMATGKTTGYSLMSAEQRGQLFVGQGEEVYAGMVIGEYTRAEDLEVNIVREKKLTNMRKSTSDELVKLTPPTVLNLEQSLEFCANDECVEVTPESVRIRKVELDSHLRGRQRSRAKAAAG